MRYLPLLLLLTLLVSCKKNDVPADPNGAVQVKNISYGSHSQQTMDIYLPAGRSTTSTKVVILIHGGGWNTGDKSDFRSYVDSLKKRDPSFAIFNINYRLAEGSNLFPAQEQDVKAAVEFILSKSSEYKISDKLILIGASAGAHLALLQAYKYNFPVKAVVDFFGPTDLVDLYNNPPNTLIPPQLETVTGGDPISQTQLYEQSSPINYVNTNSCPTLIFHGGLDMLVSISQSTTLVTELQTNNVANEYVFYQTEGHGWTGSKLSDSFDRIEVFLAIHVN